MAVATSVPGDLLPGALAPLNAASAIAELVNYSHTAHSRLNTGWSVDDSCGRIGLGELALVLARSGSGKSTLLLNIIRNSPEVPTLVVNMEMTARRQIEWLTSMTLDMEVPSRDIEELLRTGPSDERFEELMYALHQMPEIYPNLHFVMPSRPSVSDLKYLMDDVEDSSGVRPVRVFCDHLGLMRGCTDYTGYLNMTSGLHSWAGQEGIAVYVLQQTGRNSGNAKNDGHMPLSMSDGVYGGEADADWMYGLFRPDRNPKFKKSQYDFDDPYEYFRMQQERDALRGKTILQVIKNRPFSDLLEDGIELIYDVHTRRLEEPGDYHS